jgi:hypothetical protein
MKLQQELLRKDVVEEKQQNMFKIMKIKSIGNIRTE